MKQLELFPEVVDYEKEMKNMKKEMNRFRKSLFAQQGDLRKQYTEIAHELQILKLNICRGKITV